MAAYLARSRWLRLVWSGRRGLNRRTYLAPLIFGNTGNLGLPLALFAFGDEGLSYAVVVFAIMAIWSFTFGIWLVAGAGSFGKVLREPLVWATLLGGLFLWQDWQTPLFLTNTLELIGQMAIPLMLITLGVAVARLDAGGESGGPSCCRWSSWRSVPASRGRRALAFDLEPRGLWRAGACRSRRRWPSPPTCWPRNTARMRRRSRGWSWYPR